MACGRSAAHPGSPPRAPRLGRQENRRAGEPQSAGIRSLPGAPNLGEPPEQLRGRVEAGVEPRSAGGIVSLGDESDCAQLSPAVRTALSRQRHTVECFHFPPRFLPNSRQLHSTYTTRPQQRFYLAIRLITIDRLAAICRGNGSSQPYIIPAPPGTPPGRRPSGLPDVARWYAPTPRTDARGLPAG